MCTQASTGEWSGCGCATMTLWAQIRRESEYQLIAATRSYADTSLLVSTLSAFFALTQAASSVLPHQSKQRRELGAQLLEDEQSSHTNSHSRDARYRQRAPAGPIAEEPGGQTSTQHLPGDGLMSEQQLITQQCLSRRQEGLTRGVQTVSRILRRRKWWVWAVVTVVAVRAIKQGADEKQKGVGSDSRASAVERVARHEAQEANSGEESEAGEDLGSSEDASKAPDSSRTSLKDRVAYVFGL